MTAAPELLLIGTVAAVGVLHTIVPDHWVPITLIARQRAWTSGQVARAAFIAGTGHVLSTLLIGLLVWVAGVAFATKFGNLISIVSSIALIAFGGWIAVSSLLELRSGGHHHHDDAHAHDLDEYHNHDDEHDHDHGNRHDDSDGGHDHDRELRKEASDSKRSQSSRTALLLILGSSPMVEGLPAFFAAAKFGPGVIAAMAVVFAIATISTYVALCVSSASGLAQVRLGPLERYGEVLSGALIAIVGVIFLIFPVL